MTLLITLAVIYGAGLIVTVIVSGITYSIEKDYGDEDARRAARWLLGSPVWPILVFRTLLGMLAAAKETLKGDQ